MRPWRKGNFGCATTKKKRNGYKGDIRITCYEQQAATIGCSIPKIGKMQLFDQLAFCWFVQKENGSVGGGLLGFHPLDVKRSNGGDVRWRKERVGGEGESTNKRQEKGGFNVGLKGGACT